MQPDEHTSGGDLTRIALGFRGVDAANLGDQIIHRGKFNGLTAQQRRWLKHRQAVEPAVGHLKYDNAMDRCWPQGATGDTLLAILTQALSTAIG